MKLKTRENTELNVTVKWLDYEPDGIISFRYMNGMFCSSYYVKAFQEIEGGLTLDGAYLDTQTLSANAVKSCQRFILVCKELRNIEQ